MSNRAPICEICGNAMPDYRSMSICEQCQADAKLGRLVRKIPAGSCLGRTFGNQWSMSIWNTSEEWDAETIEQALEAAGVTDE